jgi:hypothetical protein
VEEDIELEELGLEFGSISIEEVRLGRFARCGARMMLGIWSVHLVVTYLERCLKCEDL